MLFQAPHGPEPGLEPSVICLDRVVRVLLDDVQRRGYQLVEDPRVDRRAVGRDLGRDRAGAQRPGEEAPRGRQVTPPRQQNIYDLAVLIDRPVEIGPLTGDLQVGLVGKPPVTGSVAARPVRLDELGGEPLDPPVDSDVIDGDSTLGQQLPGGPVGQSLAQVPADGDRDHLGGNRKPAKTEAMPGAVTGPVSRLPRISRCNSAGVGSRPPTVPRREMLAQPNVELTRPVQHWQTSSAHVTWFSAPTRARWLARRWCYRPRGWHRRRWWLVAAGCRVVAPALVGFGRSGKPDSPGDFSYESHVRWLSSFVVAVGLKDAV